MIFAIFTDSITDLNVASRTVVQNGASMDQASGFFPSGTNKKRKIEHKLSLFPLNIPSRS
jgi:hypothetical protein